MFSKPTSDSQQHYAKYCFFIGMFSVVLPNVVSPECRGAVIFFRLLKNSQLLLKREDERLEVDTNHRMRINTGKKRGEQRGEKIQLPPENWTQGVNVIILCLSLTVWLNKLDSCECTPALTRNIRLICKLRP
jgi:hypothetical protein